MSIPPDQAKSAIGGFVAPAANMGGQNAQAWQASNQQAQTPQQAPVAVQIAAHQALVQLIDGRVTAALAAAKAEEVKVVALAKKYWPIAAGLAVAATRLIH
jgi:hypothetical protein